VRDDLIATSWLSSSTIRSVERATAAPAPPSLLSGITASGSPPSPIIAIVGRLTMPPSASFGSWCVIR
jgi:hypothetical protein